MKKHYLLCIAVCMSTVLNAQLTFTIKLADGLQQEVVKNYLLQLKNVKTAAAYTAITDENGVAVFRDIPSIGKYNLSAPASLIFFQLEEDILINQNNQTVTVYLTPIKSSRLDEVIVSGCRSERIARVRQEAACLACGHARR